MENDMLIPYIGVITDIRDETGDVKTFRVVGRDEKNCFTTSPVSARYSPFRASGIP